MQMLLHIGLLYFQAEMKQLISIALVLNIFLIKIKKSNGNKNIKANIFRVQSNDLVMCEYFCLGFIDFILPDKELTYYTNLFSLHDLKKMII